MSITRSAGGDTGGPDGAGAPRSEETPRSVETTADSRRVLLTGATGYIGGRLLRPLEAGDVRLRCLARRPEHLRPRVSVDTEVVEGDLLEADSLREPLHGVDVAYYLVHSMGSSDDFERRDREAAENFAVAARDAGIRRIVYLGALGHGEELSDHLRSRQEVGEILRGSGVPTLELRASIIIGSGSLSFEMIRTLVERLPVMVCPSWVRTPAQPIAVEDVVDYLLAALDHPDDESVVYEIGGEDRVSYAGIMREYARERGLRRIMIPVPVLSPRLSSLWLGLVTPVYARIGRKLVDGLRNPTVVRDDRALRDFDVEPRGIREAIARALINEDEEFARTRWTDAFSSAGETRGWGGQRVGSRQVDSRVGRVTQPPSRAFEPIRRIGGDVGWYYANYLWRLRGFLDLLVGGVGTRRGRRDPEEPLPGDTLDFWRVEAYEPDRLLRLRAEMKLPGRAWLQFEVEEAGEGMEEAREETEEAGEEMVETGEEMEEPGEHPGSVVRQSAIFDAVGLGGLLYWYALYPLHALIFRGMFREILREANRAESR